MATSSSSAMKSSLVLVLLLSAVVASQAHQVSCTNRCKKAIRFNGVWVGPGEKAIVEVVKEIECVVYHFKGVKHVGKYRCPEEAKKVEFWYEGGCVKAGISEISGDGSTVSAEYDVPIQINPQFHSQFRVNPEVYPHSIRIVSVVASLEITVRG